MSTCTHSSWSESLACVAAVHCCVHGVDSLQVKRGGLITFHGPGQLVCYPVLNLRHMKVSKMIMRCCYLEISCTFLRLSACVPLLQTDCIMYAPWLILYVLHDPLYCLIQLYAGWGAELCMCPRKSSDRCLQVLWCGRNHCRRNRRVGQWLQNLCNWYVRSTLCDHGTGTPSLLVLNLLAF